MDIRNAAIYCRGDDTEYQAGLGMSFIIDKCLSYCGLFADEPEDENPVESLRKLLYHCRYGSIDVIIIKNYDIIEEGSVKRQLSQANLIQPIIGAEDLYCSDEDLDLETLKYEKKRSAGRIHITSAKDLDNAEISEALRRVYESRRWSGYIAGVVPYGFKRL